MVLGDEPDVVVKGGAKIRWPGGWWGGKVSGQREKVLAVR